jgi:hypothetical protein
MEVNYEYEQLDEFSTKLEICTNVSRNVQTFHETSRKINKILKY